eukprot:scaffold4298_cov183-Amphora_coffeaeformis.AAC.9
MSLVIVIEIVQFECVSAVRNKEARRGDWRQSKGAVEGEKIFRKVILGFLCDGILKVETERIIDGLLDASWQIRNGLILDLKVLVRSLLKESNIIGALTRLLLIYSRNPVPGVVPRRPSRDGCVTADSPPQASLGDGCVGADSPRVGLGDD